MTSRHLLLVGGGHAHAQVLLDIANARRRLQASHLARFAGTAPADLAGLRVTLITPDDLAPYSGMIPGWLGGHFDWDACCVNFRRLCEMAGAQLQRGEVARLDADGQTLTLQDGSQLAYDILSINIGSTLHPHSDGSLPLLPLRPLAHLHQHWERMQQQIRALPPGSGRHLLMVGGGPAGVESLLAAQHRLQQIAPQVHIKWTLITSGKHILPGMAGSTIKRLARLLRQRQVHLLPGFDASHIACGKLHARDGRSLRADGVLWATGAQAHAWPQQSALALDAQGFIRIDASLRSISHPNVFAVGDCCSWGRNDSAALSADAAHGLPKAGVFAVRMGPVLSRNLQAMALAPDNGTAPLARYRPQRHYLVLIGTGDAQAVASRGSFSLQGGWVWCWKNRIDQRFLARFNGPEPD